MVSAKLPFMTRLPKKWGIARAEEDKSLILRQLLICFKKKRRPVFLASFPVPSEKDYL
jgi:hypothetical protein